MPVSETRLAIRLDDRATAGLQSLTGVYSRFSSTVQNSGRQMGGFASNANQAASSLSNMNQMMERLVYSASRYFVIYKALGAVGNVWDTLVGGSYEYAKSLETNQIGIAGILKSMVTLNGEQIKWNDAMALSGKAMNGLQSEALRTAATSKELIETFRALLGPGLSSGMSIDQIVQLSTVGTNAVRSLGLPTNQYVQELRSIITEGIRPASSTLATSLGITNKDIKEAKASAEGLFNFLMKRMQGFSDAVKYTSGTVEGRIARIQEGLQVAGEKGAKALYQSFSSVLEDVANYLIPVPENLGDKWKINPAFIQGIKDVSDTVGKVVKSIGDIGKTVAPILGGIGGAGLTAIGHLADKLTYVAGFFAARKLAPFAADIAQIAVNSRNAYEAQTGLGRVIQGVSDKISGRTAALRQMAEQEQRAAEAERLHSAELQKVNAAISQMKAYEKSFEISKQSKTISSWWQSKDNVWKAADYSRLCSELRMLGTETERVNELTRLYFQYLKAGSREGAEDIYKLIVAEEKEILTKKQQNEEHAKWGESVRTSAERAGTLMSSIGGLTMGFGLLCDVLAQADEENKEWYASAGDAAMTGGMFAMAIGSITSAVASMIPMIHRGIEALQGFAKARVLAGIGLVGGVVAGVGALVYNAYKKFQETGVASQVDPWTGEEVSYKYNGGAGGTDADDYPIINDPSYNYGTTANTGTIGLQDFGHAGVGDAAKAVGGAAKANKAEEYAAKMLKIYEDLNKEIANMSGQTTAYDKVMAQAKDKLAGYEKDIVKAQQLGVDVGEVRNKQLEYQLAMEKKATEAQQDEYLKYMKQDEEAANRINIMGGTMEQQRAALAERLEIHKAYLEELLAANIENRDRKMQLEQELANVQKQINDNSVYDFKSGWTQALDEIANRQVNFKEQVVGVFDSIKGSLVTLVSSTGSAKDKFKQFCQDVTNTILKSMTQIIIQGLITKAILGAIGFGGGSKVTQTATGWVQDFGNGVKVSNMPTNIRTHASGGFASAGEWAMVGEQGPELVRFGSAGRVYNNNETKSMLGGGIENVKVEIVNKSGQEVKSNEANVRFDGKTMIISTVIEAVSTNYMGMRSMLKGVATT